MARIVKERCIHCNKVMRNDGSEKEPKWVCNSKKCADYVPPTEDNKNE